MSIQKKLDSFRANLEAYPALFDKFERLVNSSRMIDAPVKLDGDREQGVMLRLVEAASETGDAPEAVLVSQVAGETDTESVSDWISPNPHYPTLQSLIEGVEKGELLVHVRGLDRDSMSPDYVEPFAGPTVRATEMGQWGMEAHGDLPELIFLSDDFDWAKSDFLKNTLEKAGYSEIQAVFVSKPLSGCVRIAEGGMIEDMEGNTMRWEQGPMADHEDDMMRDMPANAETGDYIMNETITPWHQTSVLVPDADDDEPAEAVVVASVSRNTLISALREREAQSEGPVPKSEPKPRSMTLG